MYSTSGVEHKGMVAILLMEQDTVMEEMCTVVLLRKQWSCYMEGNVRIRELAKLVLRMFHGI